MEEEQYAWYRFGLSKLLRKPVHHHHSAFTSFLTNLSYLHRQGQGRQMEVAGKSLQRFFTPKLQAKT